ncbi:MAG: hypothetical protein KGN34_13185 [Sphingomonadales bacterium]|nr:hypothetical protein [Sphingomonadales bacterium]
MEPGSIAAWVGTGIAGLGAVLAMHQLRLATQAQKNQVAIASANLLLSIDAAYEGSELMAGRMAVRALRHRAEAKVGLDGVYRSDDATRKLVCAECSKELGELWQRVKNFAPDTAAEKRDGLTPAEHYARVMALPFWFETIGRLCARKLLPVEDILNLYDQVIITTMFAFEEHIRARRSEGPFPNPRFMENAMALYAKAQAYKQKRDDPHQDRPAESGMEW